jgi:hypothetical protein
MNPVVQGKGGLQLGQIGRRELGSSKYVDVGHRGFLGADKAQLVAIVIP